MEYIEQWVVKRTGEIRYGCKLCSRSDIGGTLGLDCHLKYSNHNRKIMQLDELHCKACDLHCKYPSVFNVHIRSKTHIQKVNPQPITELKCETCSVNFRCNRELKRHLATKKHAKLAKTDSLQPTLSE